VSLLEARIKDEGVKDLSPKGLLSHAMETGNESLIKPAKHLVEMNEEFERKRAEFLKNNEELMRKIARAK
jgi:hypothetical protein